LGREVVVSWFVEGVMEGLGRKGFGRKRRGTVLSVLGTGEAGSRVCGREVE
jgi:hypothetical protein